MRQRMELTGTNRSCGLTTYFFRTLELVRALSSAPRNPPRLRFEARREKVKAISNCAIRDSLCVSETHVERSSAHQSDCRPQLATSQHLLRTSFIFFLAAIPKRSHPFPSRTRKLSFSGPMVL